MCKSSYFIIEFCQRKDEWRQTVHEMGLQEIWVGQIWVGSQHCVLFWRTKQKKNIRCMHSEFVAVMWGTCSTDQSPRIGAAFPVIFQCSNASEIISITDNKRSRWERKPALLLRHIILGTPTFMHHVGSTLSLMRFMKRAYKGKSEPNISRWREMLCTHTKVYIFPLKNNYSLSRPFVSGRFDKARGTIHHYEWKETLWIFSVLYFSIFRSLALRRWWFVVYDLWFFGLGKQTCPACVNISQRGKKEKILLYDTVI